MVHLPRQQAKSKIAELVWRSNNKICNIIIFTFFSFFAFRVYCAEEPGGKSWMTLNCEYGDTIDVNILTIDVNKLCGLLLRVSQFLFLGGLLFAFL